MSTTMTATSKNSATMRPLYKAGAGWQYDDPNITYDGATDIEGRQVLYDSIGTATTMTAQSKTSVTLTPLAKN